MDELRARIAGIPFLEGRKAAIGLGALTGAALMANPLVASFLLAATTEPAASAGRLLLGGMPLALGFIGAKICGYELSRVRWREPWQILRDAGTLLTGLRDGDKAGQLKSSDALYLDNVHRFRPVDGGICLGFSQDTGEPIVVTDDLLTRHLYILGKSGMGKTVEMFYMTFQQIARGGGMLFVDGKMDDINLVTIWHYLCWSGRQQDLLVINPGNPAMSNTYNPVLYGSADEKAARVIGMIPDTSNNPGSDYYRQEATQGLTTIFAALDKAGLSYHAMDLAALLNNDEMLIDLEKRLDTQKEAEGSDELKNFKLFLDKFRIPDWDTRSGNAGGLDVKKMKDTLGGVVSRLFQFGVGTFAPVMSCHRPEVQLYDAILQGKVVYTALPTMGKSEVAASFGKLLVGDLRTAISWVQELPEEKRPRIPFMALLDEAGSYATQQLTRIAEQSRSARIFVVPAVQTSSNFRAISEDVEAMITGNTHTKIFFQIGEPDSAERAAEFLGMEKTAMRSVTISQSDSTSSQALRLTPDSNEGGGSGISYAEREQEEYRVSADKLKALEIGQAVIAIGYRNVHNARVPRIMIADELKEQYGRPRIWKQRDSDYHRGRDGEYFRLVDAPYYSGGLKFLEKRRERQAEKAQAAQDAKSGEDKKKPKGVHAVSAEEAAMAESISAEMVVAVPATTVAATGRAGETSAS